METSQLYLNEGHEAAEETTKVRISHSSPFICLLWSEWLFAYWLKYLNVKKAPLQFFNWKKKQFKHSVSLSILIGTWNSMIYSCYMPCTGLNRTISISTLFHGRFLNWFQVVGSGSLLFSLLLIIILIHMNLSSDAYWIRSVAKDHGVIISPSIQKTGVRLLSIFPSLASSSSEDLNWVDPWRIWWNLKILFLKN